MPPKSKKSTAKSVPKTYAGARTTRSVPVAILTAQSDSGGDLEPESEDNQLSDAFMENLAEHDREWLRNAAFGNLGHGPAPPKDAGDGPAEDDIVPLEGDDDRAGEDVRPSSANCSIDLQPTGSLIHPISPSFSELIPDFDHPNSDADDNAEPHLPMVDTPAAQSSPVRARSSRIAAKAPMPVTPKPAAKPRRKRQPSTPAATKTPSPTKRPAKKAKAKHGLPPSAPPISLAQADAALGNTTAHQNQRRVSFLTNPIFIDSRAQNSQYDRDFPPIPPSPATPAAASRGSSPADDFSQSDDEGELVTMSKAELRRMLNKSGESRMNAFTARAHSSGKSTPIHLLTALPCA
ncbi:hypothetical protein C8J57DRAFT_1491906 [Mycena rebaudengoi]|nr:hypothetical protein C8J57DRAFT_1491906 [Mycena rebaudengoi]